jgi:hypothetical protein
MAVTSAQAQGRVSLNNYASSGNQILYGSGVPGGAAGTPILNAGGLTWTVGIYGAIGAVTVAADPTGIADPATLGAVTLMSGIPGDTAPLQGAGGGYFQQANDAVLPGYTSGTATFVVIAYSGANYNSSSYRGHSAGFNLTPATGAASAPLISTAAGGMPSFSTFGTGPVPEPSILALSGIGAAALMLIRRKK